MSARALAAAVAAALGAACGTIDLGDPPADVNTCRPSPAYFTTEIWPNVLDRDYGGKRCSDGSCHGSGSARELVVAPPSSAPVLPLPPDWDALYRSVAAQVRCTNVDASPLLTNIDGRETHGGGKLIEPDGAEATAIKTWAGMR